MSLLNGLGTGLAAFGALGLKDEAEQQAEAARTRPLLNSAPAGVTGGIAGAPGATAATDVLAPSVKGVPPDLIPIYQAASKRTGIPIDVLIAQGKQESGFNPDAVGGAGEIGIHQIKPSTASAPGFGLKGIDPATLKDAATNINFAAAYLKARAGNIDWSNPKQVAAALASYNGGGDPAYAQHVLRYAGTS